MATETRKKLDPKALAKLGLKLVEGPPDPVEVRAPKETKGAKKINTYNEVVGEELALLISTAPAIPLTLELVRSSLKIVPDSGQPQTKEAWISFIESTPIPARVKKAEVQARADTAQRVAPAPEIPRNREGIDGFTVQVDRKETEYGRATFQRDRVATGTVFVPMAVFERGMAGVRTYVEENNQAFVAQNVEVIEDTQAYEGDEVMDTEVDDTTVTNLGQVMERYQRR